MQVIHCTQKTRCSTVRIHCDAFCTLQRITNYEISVCMQISILSQCSKHTSSVASACVRPQPRRFQTWQNTPAWEKWCNHLTPSRTLVHDIGVPEESSTASLKLPKACMACSQLGKPGELHPHSHLLCLFLPVRRERARPKVGSPKESQDVGLVQRRVVVRSDHFGMHLRVLGPVHVAVHVVDCVVPIVAGEPIYHRAGEVASRVDIHVRPLVLSQDNVFCSIVLQNVPRVGRYFNHRSKFPILQ